MGHLELMDKLSVAAGVTAKDKRSKNKANMAYHTRLAKKSEYRKAAREVTKKIT